MRWCVSAVGAAGAAASVAVTAAVSVSVALGSLPLTLTRRRLDQKRSTTFSCWLLAAAGCWLLAAAGCWLLLAAVDTADVVCWAAFVDCS